MGLAGRIKINWNNLTDNLASTSRYWYISPSKLSLLRAVEPKLKDLIRGRVLDAGAGKMPYRPIIEKSNNEAEYVSFDVDDSSGAIDHIGDVQALPFEDQSFDVVFCAQVLEHVPEPQQALSEFARVLRPGGHIILTVPHLGYIHNEPHDYFRYTKYALEYMAGRAGLRVNDIQPVGGLPVFLGHLISTVLIGATYHLPFIGSGIVRLNSGWAKTVVRIDARLDKKKRFALNYLLVAEKAKPDVTA